MKTQILAAIGKTELLQVTLSQAAQLDQKTPTLKQEGTGRGIERPEFNRVSA